MNAFQLLRNSKPAVHDDTEENRKWNLAGIEVESLDLLNEGFDEWDVYQRAKMCGPGVYTVTMTFEVPES